MTKLSFEEFKVRYITSQLTEEAKTHMKGLFGLDIEEEIDNIARMEYNLYLEIDKE